jgi:hypothetical protein
MQFNEMLWRYLSPLEKKRDREKEREKKGERKSEREKEREKERKRDREIALIIKIIECPALTNLTPQWN